MRPHKTEGLLKTLAIDFTENDFVLVEDKFFDTWHPGELGG